MSKLENMTTTLRMNASSEISVSDWEIEAVLTITYRVCIDFVVGMCTKRSGVVMVHSGKKNLISGKGSGPLSRRRLPLYASFCRCQRDRDTV